MLSNHTSQTDADSCVSVCPSHAEIVSIARDDDDENFNYFIDDNRRDADYGDAFCDVSSSIELNARAEYFVTATSRASFTLSELRFQFVGAPVVTVEVMTYDGFTIKYQVCLRTCTYIMIVFSLILLL